MSNANANLSTNLLNIASYATHTRALGPGYRAVIWTQGCPLRCPGCIAPAWIPFTPAKLISPEALLAKLDLNAIDGVTLSGGEPMEQAAGLAKLIRLARQQKDVNLICFTGYRYETLLEYHQNDGVKELLDEVDALIDGPYVQAKNDSKGLRGSTNQRIHHLTSRLRSYDFETQKRNMEVTVRDGELSFVGIPTPEVKSAMDQVLISSLGRIESYERL